MEWQLGQITTQFKTPIFEIQTAAFEVKSDLGATSHVHYRIHCRDWVTILPVTREGQAVLITQPRVGTVSEVWETPGGVVDESERDVTQAALRELEEETGLTSSRILPLASINPNPAIMTNRCHFFLALDCLINMQRTHFPDSHEFIRAKAFSTPDLENMVRQGMINHGLSALCVMLALKYIQPNAR